MLERDRAPPPVALLRRKSLRDLVLASPCERGSYRDAKHSLDRERQETARSPADSSFSRDKGRPEIRFAKSKRRSRQGRRHRALSDRRHNWNVFQRPAGGQFVCKDQKVAPIASFVFGFRRTRP